MQHNNVIKAKESARKVADEAQKTADEAKKAAEALETPENAVKVEILRAHPQYGYFAGDVADVAPEDAELLLASGHAKQVVAEVTDETPNE